MDAARNIVAGNRSLIVNVIYIIAFLVVVYYLYKFYVAGSELDVDLLTMRKSANLPTVLPITSDKRPKIRIRTGGEYTLSMWLYITSWDTRAGLPKAVFQLLDSGIRNNSLLMGVLYPNETKMMIRAYTGTSGTGATDYTSLSNYESLMKTGSSGSLFNPSGEMPQCDIQDIDLQRWIHVAVSVNGRIMDIYMDGKLARSCILPDVPQASETGMQSLVMCPSGGFAGHISSVQFFNYAVTPDRIYSTYQAGPYSNVNFITYVGEKLGFKLLYTDAEGKKQSTV